MNTSKMSSSSFISLSLLILIPFVVIVLVLNSVGCVVVHQVRFIATKNGRTDYALSGESIELSCHYIMKDEAEDVKQLIWSKDGKNFLRWRKNKPGLEVLSYTFKGHLDKSSAYQHLIIHNVTIDMHGKYKCSVKTDLGSQEAEQDLVVISQSGCRLSDWRVVSQPNQCRELYHFDCRNMFPKPEPSCGLWNGKLERFIRSVMVDISEETNNKQTYRIKYSGKFELGPSGNKGSIYDNTELLQYAGHLMFKCDITVPDTSWKLSLVHRMFDYQDACFSDPLETVERMRLNYSHYAHSRLQQAGYLNQGDEFELIKMISRANLDYKILVPNLKNGSSSGLNCWQKPRFGSLARLSCANKASHMKLMGTNLLECRPSGWVPASSSKLVQASTSDKGYSVIASKDNNKQTRQSRRIESQPVENIDLLPGEVSTTVVPQSELASAELSSIQLSISSTNNNNASSTVEDPDNSSRDSSSAQVNLYETTTQTSGKEFEFIPDTDENEEKSHLTAIPPTCVSIVKSTKPTTINDFHSSANLNALSSRVNSHHSSGTTKSNDDGFILRFPSSSSSTHHPLESFHTMLLASLLCVSFTLLLEQHDQR